MSDIYISKIHGAKLKDEELTQKVSEGLVEHENKLELLSNSIPYEWQYTDGRSKLLHYDWNIGAFGTMYEYPTRSDGIRVGFYLDLDSYGVYHLDAWSYAYEDLDDGGRCWYFKIRFDDGVRDGYYVFALEAGSEWVKETGYNAVLYQCDWEDKNKEEKSFVSLNYCILHKGMTERRYSDTYYTDSTSGKNLQTAPDVYSFDSIEDAFSFEFKVYKSNGDVYKNYIDTVSGLVAALKEYGLTEYTQTITTCDGLQFYLDISADDPLILTEAARVVYGDVIHGDDTMDCDFIPYAEDGKNKICKICRIFTMPPK